MTNKSRKLKILSLPVAALGLLLAAGSASQIFAQRDPFAKSGAQKAAAPRTSSPTSSAPAAAPVAKPKPPAPGPLAAPSIEDRIAYYKRLRENAALNNQPIPNPTVVMTLDELSVSGIFQSSRGYAAIVEAKPIKLSYTVYPGDKFFDGQLVAVEENKLVFKRVTKWSNGKFVASEENKSLREYTVDQQVQGTAPIEPAGKTESAANTQPADPNAAAGSPAAKPTKTIIVATPFEEMSRQPSETKDTAKSKSDKKDRAGNSKKQAKTKTAAAQKSAKKTVKVAVNKDL